MRRSSGLSESKTFPSVLDDRRGRPTRDKDWFAGPSRQQYFKGQSCIAGHAVTLARGRMREKRSAASSVPVPAGKPSGTIQRRKEMSIARIAVEAHLHRNPTMDIRQLLSAAYYKRHSKEMPTKALDEDVRRWQAGENNFPYLYDLIFQTETGP